MNTLMVSGYPVLDGQSRSQFTSSSASTTLSLAAIGLHSEETVSHTFPHCAANAEITNFSFLFFFLFPLSAESLIIGRTTHFRLFQNFFFFKRAREPRNKPRDLNLPISQNTWRSSNISPFSIIEQCANLSELPVQILPCLLRQTPTYIDDKNKNYIHIYIIPSTNQ